MRFLLYACVLALVVAGCGTSASSARRHDAAVLRWGLAATSDISTLDPALVSDPTSISLSSLVYGGLVRLDEHLKVRPDGASSWSISPDGTTYTFTVRPNLRFADGRHATVRDFVQALLRATGSSADSPSGSPYLSLIRKGSIRQSGAHLLQFRLTKPASYFLAELAFPASFVPDLRVVARNGASWTDHASGFGPFFVSSWHHGKSLTLKRNPYYFGGKAAFKRVEVRMYGQTSTAQQAYDAGTLDIVSGLDAGRPITAKTAGLRRVPGLALDYLAFNTTRLPFFRLRARQAFAVASPPRLANAMGQAAFPTSNFLPPDLGLRSSTWVSKIRPSTYLAAARYGGARPLPPVVLLVPHDPYVYRLAQALTRAWRARMGIDVPIRQLNPSNFSAVLNARRFDLALVRWGADYPDPQDFLATQLGSSRDNATGWSRRAYTRLIQQAERLHPEDGHRLKLFRHAADLAASKVPLVPLDEPAVSAIIAPDLSGVALTSLGTIVGNWPRATFGG